MKKFALIVLCMLACFGGLQAQDSNSVRKDIDALTSRSMFGRGYAYHGDSIAADYIVKRFQSMQLETKEQEYKFPVYAMEGPVSIILNGKVLKGWEDFVIAPFSPTMHASLPIVDLDYRILLDQPALDNFFAKNKKAKKSMLYVDLTRCQNADTLKTLQRLFGMLQRFKDSFRCKGFILGVDEMSAWTVGMGYHKCQYALIYVKKHLMDAKKNTIKISYTNEARQHHTRNVCAMIPGTEVPDSMVVLTAHYDHLGMMGEEVMFPGCHDNASGTASVLDLANYFRLHPLKYTVEIVVFSAEEAGLLGSTYFVSHPLFDLKKVKMVVNLDLMCGGDDGIMVVNAKDSLTNGFYNSLVQLNADSHWVKEVKARDNAANSDHFPFTEKGVPAIFIYTLGGRTGGYHNPYDTSAGASLTAYQGIAHLVIEALEQLR
ncbi:MAG: M28 family peptidase [Bacteroidales bacterium]|nr:M28 family peptidase [Bacteroidales bacterium]